jgi:tetratricopeptide (TPR) repeat protein
VKRKAIFAALLSLCFFPAARATQQTQSAAESPLPPPVSRESPSQRSPHHPTSEEYFREGSKLYIMEDYSGAIGPYQKALDLEKQDRDLPHTKWLVLIDNLGMAYGITGDLDHAQQVFEYGIRKEPGYPLFYYNLACTYAERKNMDRAMSFLKTAFDLKANLIPGETMPDPRRDDSFQEFMKDKKFRDFVNSLVAAH